MQIPRLDIIGPDCTSLSTGARIWLDPFLAQIPNPSIMDRREFEKTFFLRQFSFGARLPTSEYHSRWSYKPWHTFLSCWYERYSRQSCQRRFNQVGQRPRHLPRCLMVFAWWTQTQHFLQTKKHALCRLISVLTKSCPVTRFTSSVRSPASFPTNLFRNLSTFRGLLFPKRSSFFLRRKTTIKVHFGRKFFLTFL